MATGVIMRCILLHREQQVLLISRHFHRPLVKQCGTVVNHLAGTNVTYSLYKRPLTDHILCGKVDWRCIMYMAFFLFFL